MDYEEQIIYTQIDKNGPYIELPEDDNDFVTLAKKDGRFVHRVRGDAINKLCDLEHSMAENQKKDKRDWHAFRSLYFQYYYSHEVDRGVQKMHQIDGYIKAFNDMQETIMEVDKLDVDEKYKYDLLKRFLDSLREKTYWTHSQWR